MDKSERHAQAVSNGCRSLRFASIWTDDDGILPVGNVLLDIPLEERLSVKIIDGNVKESLHYIIHRLTLILTCSYESGLGVRGTGTRAAQSHASQAVKLRDIP